MTIADVLPQQGMIEWVMMSAKTKRNGMWSILLMAAASSAANAQGEMLHIIRAAQT